jgi:hypothetical protein
MELLHLSILLGVFLIPAILAAFAADVLRSAIALLFTSVGLTLILFMVNAPLAASGVSVNRQRPVASATGSSSSRTSMSAKASRPIFSAVG